MSHPTEFLFPAAFGRELIAWLESPVTAPIPKPCEVIVGNARGTLDLTTGKIVNITEQFDLTHSVYDLIRHCEEDNAIIMPDNDQHPPERIYLPENYIHDEVTVALPAVIYENRVLLFHPSEAPRTYSIADKDYLPRKLRSLRRLIRRKLLDAGRDDLASSDELFGGNHNKTIDTLCDNYAEYVGCLAACQRLARVEEHRQAW